MDKRIKRFVFSAVTLVIVGPLVILARSERFRIDKNPVYEIILFSFLVGYIGYEQLYRRPKIDKTKKNSRNKRLEEMLSQIEIYTPKPDINKVPEEFHSLLPLVKHWGVSNKMLRDHFYEKASKSELQELKKIEPFITYITRWIESFEHKNEEHKAFEQTLLAYNELGLWAWNE
ncbi:hypothetical protein GC194_09455 [bacterium]|nr:hypothetical protein [bacterium]